MKIVFRDATEWGVALLLSLTEAYTVGLLSTVGSRGIEKPKW